MPRNAPQPGPRRRKRMEAEVPSATFGPLVELLLAELEACGQADGLRQPPRSLAGFTRWYLDVVQRLDAYLAGGDDHAPMARAEVELMCRCALSASDLREVVVICARFADML